MNTQNVTTGGYTGSEMYTSGLDQAKQIVTQDFGTNVLSHREFFTNTVADGHASSGTWFDSTVDLPNEIMMYGSYIFTPGATDTVIPYLYTIDKTQLALMQVAPFYINPARQNIWLRDVVSASNFPLVRAHGDSGCYYASGVFGVRPVTVQIRGRLSRHGNSRGNPWGLCIRDFGMRDYKALVRKKMAMYV